MRRLEVAARARRDIADLLAVSAASFGSRGRARYAEVLARAIDNLLADPLASGSQSRPDLASDVRLYNLRSARQRPGAKAATIKSPRHLIAYVATDDVLTIARVLHERMDLPTQFSNEP